MIALLIFLTAVAVGIAVVRRHDRTLREARRPAHRYAQRASVSAYNAHQAETAAILLTATPDNGARGLSFGDRHALRRDLDRIVALETADVPPIGTRS